MPSTVSVATQPVPLQQAADQVLDYCLGTEPVRWSGPRSGVKVTGPGGLVRGAYAYRTYDCVPPSAGVSIEYIDVAVADGLNAMMRAKDIASVLAVAGDLAPLIERLDAEGDGRGLVFWDLTVDEVRHKPHSDRERAWPLWAAWTLLMGVEGIDVARCHKILHHKRPKIFPLIDNQTLPWLAEGTAWASIHGDLAADDGDQAWSQLEAEVNPRLVAEGGRELTRLRLHDILLWLRATGR